MQFALQTSFVAVICSLRGLGAIQRSGQALTPDMVSVRLKARTPAWVHVLPAGLKFSGALFAEQHRKQIIAGHWICADGTPMLKS